MSDPIRREIRAEADHPYTTEDEQRHTEALREHMAEVMNSPHIDEAGRDSVAVTQKFYLEKLAERDERLERQERLIGKQVEEIETFKAGWSEAERQLTYWRIAMICLGVLSVAGLLLR